MNRLLLFALLASFYTPAFSGWEKVESGTTSHLQKIHFVDGQKGFIIGREGTLLRSNDTGKTWTNVPLGHGASNTGISFANQEVGVVCGREGKVFHTTNGGNTWSRSILPDTTADLVDVILFPDLKGYAAGVKDSRLHMWKTGDGGHTWADGDSLWERPGEAPKQLGVNAGAPSYQAAAIGFCAGNRDTAYLAAGSRILRTTDGGNGWVIVKEQNKDADFLATALFNCHFPSGATGYFTGTYYGHMFRTQDAATSLINLPSAGMSFNAVRFLSASIGYAVGSSSSVKPHIRRTLDGGAVWDSLSAPAVAFLGGIHAFDPNRLIVVGASGAIYRSTDGAGAPVNVVPQQRGTSPARPHFKGSIGRFFDALGRNVRNMQFFARSPDVGG